MNDIRHYLTENAGQIAYIARSYTGSWTIMLVKQGNITGRSISSYQRLSDEELNTLATEGYQIYDFMRVEEPKKFGEILRTMESTAKQLCY